ncbi:MAG: Holliday junction branch migration protein RuvA [Clostridiaceae bacterium]|nr:Holliday junction branch migration protein RuvA [Clostridiaceae bacterium]
MFYYLEGTIAHLDSHIAVVDCGGVGYLCSISLHTHGKLARGAKSKLYTYLNVREDTFDLYGFADLEEKNCFTLLTGVSGVGMKVALSILSTLSPDQFMLAVLSSDEKALTRAPGVGKKLAQRLILELKDKLKKEYAAADASEDFLPAADAQDKAGEARMALQALGYSASEAAAALRKVDISALSLEEIIRAALKGLVRG